jgi:hypothetical protein
VRRVALLPVVTVVALALSGCGLCGNEVSSEIESPDHSKKAVVFSRSCGVSSGYVKNVSVLPKGEKLGDGRGNVFAADVDSLVLVSWDGKDLMINYPAKARVYFQANQVNGTRVRWEPYEVGK